MVRESEMDRSFINKEEGGGGSTKWHYNALSGNLKTMGGEARPEDNAAENTCGREHKSVQLHTCLEAVL